MDILMIPISVTMVIVTLTLVCTFLGLKLNHMRNKMRWWRNEALKLNGQERIWSGPRNKVRAWWLRKMR